MTVATSPKVSNRRKAGRRLPRAIVNVECRRGTMGLGKNIVAQFLDVCEGGVRIIVSEPLAAKDEVEVTLNVSHLRKAIKRHAKVCWALPLENKTFCVGLEFEKQLTYMEVSHIARP